MTPVQEARLLRLVEEIHAVTTKQMGGGLVGDGQQHPDPPKKEEVATNPGKYYGTIYDPLKGYAPVTDVIYLFSDMHYDPEVGKEVSDTGFVGGTLYEWAKRDLKAFMAWFQHTHEGHPLILANLHPEQRAKMGLPD